MAVRKSFVEFVLDQLRELGAVSSRAMFGGVGLYHGDRFFGILWDEQLFLKVDSVTRWRYESAGMAAFRPFANKPTTMQYYAVPLAVLENANMLATWACEAVEVAERLKGGKRQRAAARGRSRPPP